jgi:mercuric ion binding protein
MKKFMSLIGFIGISGALSPAFAQDLKTDSFKVFGNCGMCKNRIEKAVATEGIKTADWNIDSKMMTVVYDPAKTTNDAIQKRIAFVGHDTEQQQAVDSVYQKLPGCCLYDRKKAAGHKHH